MAYACDRREGTYSRILSKSFRFADCISLPTFMARANSCARWSVSFAFRIYNAVIIVSVRSLFVRMPPASLQPQLESSLAAPTYLVLLVYTRADLARLDERDDLLLELLDRPPKRGAHAFHLDRRERLEVQDECAVLDHVDEGCNVVREVDVE